jgi:hypothetical protein
MRIERVAPVNIDVLISFLDLTNHGSCFWGHEEHKRTQFQPIVLSCPLASFL